MLRKLLMYAVVLIAAASIGSEIVVRLARIVDVPLFDANARQGYIPRPNQSGAFMWTHDWAFNEDSMGTERPFALSPAKDILLVGDSIVYGGNPYKADERLGPQLRKALGYGSVWPISAPSWALQNELQYLHDHPKVQRGVDAFVFISNSGDFDVPSSWASEITHPRSTPASYLIRALERYVLLDAANCCPPSPASMLVQRRNIKRDFEAFVRETDKPIVIILYPNKVERTKGARCDFAPAWLAVPGRSKIACLGDDPAWTVNAYKDDVHPYATTMPILARFAARQIGPPN